MKISGTLNYRIIKGMALIASKDSFRPNLCYVQVRRIGSDTYWVATDGRRLGILHDSGQLEITACDVSAQKLADFTFELPVPKFALFGLRDKDGRNTLRFDMDTEAVPEMPHPKYECTTVPAHGWCDWSANGVTQRVLMPNVKAYPDVMAVVPRTDHGFASVESFVFNPEYVLDAQRVVNTALGVKITGVSVLQYRNTEDHPSSSQLFIRVSECFCYILMPMRTDSCCSDTVPRWLSNLETKPSPVVVPSLEPAVTDATQTEGAK